MLANSYPSHCRLKGPTNSLVMVFLPPLVHINTNTHAHSNALHCAKWKFCVRASSRTAQLPAMPATLSKPNGLSDQQHCVWRVVHSQAFCGISGTFCLSRYACQAVRDTAGTKGWRDFLYASMIMTLFACVSMSLYSQMKILFFCLTQPLDLKDKWKTAQWFKGINIHHASRTCTKLMLVKNICTKELLPEENKWVCVKGKY